MSATARQNRELCLLQNHIQAVHSIHADIFLSKIIVPIKQH